MASWQSVAIAAMLRLARWKRAKTRPLEQFRPSVEASLARFSKQKAVSFEAFTIQELSAEWAIPFNTTSRYTILYLHGGGFILGSIKAYRSLTSHLAAATGARILTIEYRLAPEHPFPAAIEDTLTAYQWLIAAGTTPEHLIVAGDSSGGSLALTLLQSVRERAIPYPAAVVGLSPGINFALPEQAIDFKKELVLYPEMLSYIRKVYLVDGDPADPLVSPINADLRGYPPLFVQVGTRELLFDDIHHFAECARTAGVSITVEVWKDMFHGWQLFAAVLPEGRAALIHINTFLISLG